MHQALRVTPAMAANVTDGLFDVSDIVRQLEFAESQKSRITEGATDAAEKVSKDHSRESRPNLREIRRRRLDDHSAFAGAR